MHPCLRAGVAEEGTGCSQAQMRFSNTFSWSTFCPLSSPAPIHSSEVSTPVPEPPNASTHSGVPHRPIYSPYSAPNSLPLEPHTLSTSSVVDLFQVLLLPVFSANPKFLSTCTIFQMPSFLLAFFSSLTSRSLQSYTHLTSLLL